MRGIVVTGLLISVASWGPLLARGQDAPPEYWGLTVRTYNYAEISTQILKRAERRANKLFEGSRIEIHWLDCPTPARRRADNSSCDVPFGQSDFVLNLLPTSMSKKYRLNPNIFGFATDADDAGSFWISLFVGPVTRLAHRGYGGNNSDKAEALILGHVIAHELGHLLLPPGHSKYGLMSFSWDKRELALMERDLLRFSPDEEHRMQRELARRAGLLPSVASE